jgi:DNA-directed RNA polymerase specialized sigma24 family protein
MARSDPKSALQQPGTSAQFQATHWSLVLQAADGSAPGGEEALNRFCQTYWFPIYAFIRGQGTDCHQAKDLTQGFFAHLLQKDILKQVGPGRGRFRSFLLACLTNFTKDQWRKEGALKRGGDSTFFSIEEKEAEELFSDLPAHEPDSAKRFDRAWAATVVEKAKSSLKEAHAARGKPELYEALEGCLTGELSPDSYGAVAAKLGMTRETLHTNVSRFRTAFGRCLRDEVARIVATPAEIDDEIRYLMTAWAGHLGA